MLSYSVFLHQNVLIDKLELIDDLNPSVPASQVTTSISGQNATCRIALGDDALKGVLRSRQLSFAVAYNDGSQDSITIQAILLPRSQ